MLTGRSQSIRFHHGSLHSDIRRWCVLCPAQKDKTRNLGTQFAFLRSRKRRRRRSALKIQGLCQACAKGLFQSWNKEATETLAGVVKNREEWIMALKKILLQSGWGLLFILVLATLVRAANTPIWWDNPKNLPFWTQTIATGTASNTGPQAQFIIAKIDVANTYRENYSKYVWVQVEWSLVQGTGEFVTGSYDHLIKWMNSDGDCPSHPELPFPDPADGAGFMKAEGAFAPEFDFQHGFELSFSRSRRNPRASGLKFVLTSGRTAISTIVWKYRPPVCPLISAMRRIPCFPPCSARTEHVTSSQRIAASAL
jgi:hypothetical protein